MKKTIFISIGILIIVVILGILVYLVMFGAPKNAGDIFTRFGLSGNEAPLPINTDDTKVDTSPETNTGAPQRLKQLTLRPVAGAVFIDETLRYVEQGTGHVYDIDLIDGAETLVRGTTIPQAVHAVFASDGSSVAITAYEGTSEMTVIEEVEGDTEGKKLPDGSSEIQFSESTSTLMYLLEDVDGSTGYSYNIRTGKVTPVFTNALRDIHVLWGKQIHVYTTPTSLEEGYIYRVVNGELVYTAPSGLGLMGLAYNDGLIVSSITKSGLSSFVYNTSAESSILPLPVIPEKCVVAKGTSLYCSVPSNLSTGTFPDDWYKGVISYSDILWEIDVENGISRAMSDFLAESGREIDVSKIGTNVDGTYIYFVNKNDNTLWMFDTTI